MKPRYGEEIVVAVKRQGQFSWYILYVEMCYLDYSQSVGLLKPEELEERYGFLIVNENNIDEYLRYAEAEGRKTSAEILRKQVQELQKQQRVQGVQDDESMMDYEPSVLIDVDKKCYYGDYAERRFEWCVPDGWIGIPDEFMDIIPKEQRYWEDENGAYILIDREDEVDKK